VLTEQNISDGLKEVRVALLEADVNFKIVKDFVERVRQKAVGQEVLQSLTPGHQVVKLVWDELRELMGGEQSGLKLASVPPTVIMMVGLQGAGKTTSCGKLARHFKQLSKRVLLVAADPRRPAAAEQLSSLGSSLDIPVHQAARTGSTRADVVQTCVGGVTRGQDQGFDVVILDTGGRLHVDDELMEELVEVKHAVRPQEVLLVADAMTGQDAVAMSEQFDRRVGLTGVLLTKVEGDARGGAVLSIRAVTGKPIKFLGVGEKVDALEPFYPDRMASRILGMGDVLSLIEKAQETYSLEQAEAMQKKLTSKTLTLEDFRDQIGQVSQMGSFEQILGMLPGGDRLQAMAGHEAPEGDIARVVAIIDSMTPRERRDHTIINGSRKKRIARGSGRTVQDVNRLIKQFLNAKKMMKALTGTGGRRQLAQVLRSF
ncbi:MAG: signal recognition particle protein, partial [Nitrospiraceae bacterium]